MNVRGLEIMYLSTVHNAKIWLFFLYVCCISFAVCLVKLGHKRFLPYGTNIST